MNIGELARRTGLSVKTVRYYSDLGLVPEAGRTHAGHRRYDAGATLRLDFVRGLRELGLDLATIRRVLDREADLRRVAARHADAIDAQIRVLRVQRAVLRALSRRDPTPDEVERMNRIAQATADERRRIITEFLDGIFAGIPVDPQFEAMQRSAVEGLPEEPTGAQIDAWIELADLVQDQGFRELLRRMGRESFGPPEAPKRPAANQETDRLVTERVGPAVAAGIDPAGPAAGAILDDLLPAMAAAGGAQDGPGYRREMLAGLELGADPRPERYWQLLAVLKGWPQWPAKTVNYAWLRDALRSRV
ncbi:MerR family transcriptional regulator [Rhizomonospora bruguierae]|uniref:MerR family transcriptional regulator n=1 Tax=Rhizomonospora bruguierae TaxID=1581705 RepID=UPI001BCDEBA1|nr:MerR family transcriptional regulator [Micromonospora sp. NBRC 107566]